MAPQAGVNEELQRLRRIGRVPPLSRQRADFESLTGLADIHSANAEPEAARPSAIQSRGKPVACRPCLNQETGAPWKNHGQYVRCVAHAVNELRAAGLLMDEEGDHLVSGVP